MKKLSTKEKGGTDVLRKLKGRGGEIAGESKIDDCPYWLKHPLGERLRDGAKRGRSVRRSNFGRLGGKS